MIFGPPVTVHIHYAHFRWTYSEECLKKMPFAVGNIQPISEKAFF